MKASLCICVQYGEPFDRTVKYVNHFDLFKDKDVTSESQAKAFAYDVTGVCWVEVRPTECPKEKNADYFQVRLTSTTTYVLELQY